MMASAELSQSHKFFYSIPLHLGGLTISKGLLLTDVPFIF